VYQQKSDLDELSHASCCSTKRSSFQPQLLTQQAVFRARLVGSTLLDTKILNDADLVGFGQEVSELLVWGLDEAGLAPQVGGEVGIGLEESLECSLDSKQ
jgi:hypothetical protein